MLSQGQPATQDDVECLQQKVDTFRKWLDIPRSLATKHIPRTHSRSTKNWRHRYLSELVQVSWNPRTKRWRCELHISVIHNQRLYPGFGRANGKTVDIAFETALRAAWGSVMDMKEFLVAVKHQARVWTSQSNTWYREVPAPEGVDIKLSVFVTWHPMMNEWEVKFLRAPDDPRSFDSIDAHVVRSKDLNEAYHECYTVASLGGVTEPPVGVGAIEALDDAGSDDNG